MNYYNDNDPKACAWLRELIAAGELPPGDVDERSITEIKADDLAKYDQCHFFAGIGGWPLALRWAGLENAIGIWTGSCPCQPFSAAGKGLGTADARHLWPEFARLIGECRPATVFGEQVASKAGRGWLAGVRADLEGLGYAVGAADLCAAGAGEKAEGWHYIGDSDDGAWVPIVIGAPHIRQRLYWVADANDERPRGRRCSELCQCPGQRPAGPCRCACGLADTGHEQAGRATRPGEAQGGRALGDATGRRNACRLGVANCSGRLAGQPAAAPVGYGGSPQSTGRAGFWSSFDVLPCRDGKARRVESGTFPLAHGIPGRVGLLRGYGNAIVPDVAAEFVMAWEETQETHTL